MTDRNYWTRRQVIKSGAAFTALAAGGIGTACASSVSRAGAKVDWAAAQAIVDAIEPPKIPQRDVSILDHGAVSGWRNDSRNAIHVAIETAASQGGGRVVLPAGQWFCGGPIHLQSRIDLHLEEGAHLRFTGDARSYLPAVLTRWEGTEVWTWSPMLFADGKEDVALTGPGKIDGQGAQNFLPWREKQNPDKDVLRQMGIDGAPVDERVFAEGRHLRPHFVQFRDCKRVLIDGVTLVDSPFWVTHLLYCDQAIVRNIDVVSRHINSDGVDVDSSTNVLIEQCRFDVGDDGVAIKSGRDQDGWRVDRPSRNVVIRDCEYLGDTGGAMAIGSEMSGGVTDVYVERYRMDKVHHALYFKANLDRGGLIERVFIRDIEVGDADSLLIFTNDYHSYRGGNFPARFENVTVDDVRCRTARIGLSIIGHEQAPVRNVTISNLSIAQAEVPMQLEYVDNLVAENVDINGAPARVPNSVGATGQKESLRH